eukprot:GEMP01015372.1.p1 GENE.GEMP01015372.1~~GEMP01015372.1.p1  ORF type:complete len:433 (+),score=65.68 GEMP01015372.1:33-1331(+)
MACLGPLAGAVFGCCGDTQIKDGKKAITLLQIIYMIVLVVFRSATIPFDYFRSSKSKLMCGDQALDTAALDSCLQTQATYRLAWAVSSLFVLLMLFTVCGKGVQALTSCFLLKLLIPVGLFVAYFFIPDVVFNHLAYVGGVIAGVAFVYLFALVLNFAVKWNNLWTTNAMDDKRANKSGMSWFVGLLFFSFAFFATSLAGTIVLAGFVDENKQYFVTFPSSVNNVNSRQGLVIGTFVIMCILLFVSLLSAIKHGALLVSTVMMAFLITLCWGASHGNVYDKQMDHTAYLVVMALWFVLALITSARERKDSRPSSDFSTAVDSEKDDSGEVPTGFNDLEDNEYAPGTSPVPTDDADTQRKQRVKTGWTALYFFFNASLPLAVMSLISRVHSSENKSNAYFWIYAAAIISGLVLYLWYLVAPILCKGRHFGEQE